MNTSMSFSLFTEELLKRIQEKAGEEVRISAVPVKKNNGITLTGIMLEEEGRNASPTIYIDEFYERLRTEETNQEGKRIGKAGDISGSEGMDESKNISLDHIAETIWRNLKEGRLREPVDFSDFADYEKMKHRIAFKLIHYEKNRELLKDVPHKIFYNLAVVYYFTVDAPPFQGFGTVLIRHEHRKLWKVSEKELHERAVENTPRLLPVRMERMESMLLGCLEKPGKAEGSEAEEEALLKEMLEQLVKSMASDLEKLPMFVLTNEQKYFGAAAMLYQDVLKQFAAESKRDIYILPSSVHEVILIPEKSAVKPKELFEMVSEINATQVAESEVLADSVYCYSRERDRIERLF